MTAMSAISILQIQNLLRNGRADEAAEILETALGRSGRPVIRWRRCAWPARSTAIEIVGWARSGGPDRRARPARCAGHRAGDRPELAGPHRAQARRERLPRAVPRDQLLHRIRLSLRRLGPRRDCSKATARMGPSGRAAWPRSTPRSTVRGLGELYGAVYPLVEDGPGDAGARTRSMPMRCGWAQRSSRCGCTRRWRAPSRLNGLPRPMAVIVGSNESYPFYDAPVFSTAESRQFAPGAGRNDAARPVGRGSCRASGRCRDRRSRDRYREKTNRGSPVRSTCPTPTIAWSRSAGRRCASRSASNAPARRQARLPGRRRRRPAPPPVRHLAALASSPSDRRWKRIQRD